LKPGASANELRDDLDDVWLTPLRWSRYAYRTKTQTKVRARADADEAYEQKKKSKELFVEQRSGTLFDFLDEFEGVASKHVVHRSILSRQKASASLFERERRPGILGLDIDYAENFDIEEARKVQSEHWSTKQSTLFMAVAVWLDIAEWDNPTSELPASAEVTVNGSLSDKEPNSNEHWARVVRKVEKSDGDAEDLYEVLTFDKKTETVARSKLRHRVFIKQCHAGVSDDKTHDSWSMRCFVEKTIEHLKEQGAVKDHKLKVLCVHSDNAAQHFKSSKSLHYFSKQLEGMGFESIIYDFGPPGHGKGEQRYCIEL